MFSYLGRRQKKKTRDEVELGDKQRSSPQKSVDVEVDPKQNTVVPDTPASSVATVLAPTEAPKRKAKKASWWRRWLHRKTKPQIVTEDVAEDTNLPSSAAEKSVNTIKASEGGEAGAQEASPTPDTPVSPTTETGKKKKKETWWRRFLSSCCKKQKLVSPVETKDSSSESTSKDSCVINLPPGSWQPTPSGHGGGLQATPHNIGLLQCVSASTETLPTKELACLGLPNLAQTCYMNCTLQGLLTLTPFIQEVHSQRRVWGSHPKSQLMREFVDVGVCRFSNDKAQKKRVLAAFKKTVAEFNSEFEDDSQKDAHEFLTCVLDNLRSLHVNLHTAADNMGISYTCPVNAHIAFQMLSTRICKGCGVQSMRKEDYMNLSLDLVPGGSVSECLQDYLKESTLEYRCECGAEESSQQCSFWTLPNVLILQLQRFRFTRSFRLKKVNCHVALSQELLVNCEFSTTQQTRYSLVSIISHLGSTASSGHYICDGSYQQQKPGDVTDCWLTYNDKNVTETTSKSVRHQRQQTAYLLFYEKQE